MFTLNVFRYGIPSPVTWQFQCEESAAEAKSVALFFAPAGLISGCTIEVEHLCAGFPMHRSTVQLIEGVARNWDRQKLGIVALIKFVRETHNGRDGEAVGLREAKDAVDAIARKANPAVYAA